MRTMGKRRRLFDRKRWLSVALLGVAMGCYNYRVAAPNVSASTDPEPPSETQWAFFWGALEQPFDASCYCMNNALKQTTVTTNYAYALLTVITLGIVVPVQVEVVCAKPPPGSPPPIPPVGCSGVETLPPGVVPPEPDDAGPPAPPDGETDGDSF